MLGGTGNIGSAIADALEKEGAIVCRHGLAGEYAADLANSEETENLIKKVIGRFGQLDILVNSVSAPTKIGSFDKKTWQDFLAHLNIQLKATVETSSLVLPYMRKNGFGRIINVASSSVAGQPPSNLSDYVTAKYALVGFTKALAREVERFGVTVNAVSPSLVKNDFSKDFPEKMSEILIAQSPTGRLTTAEDVARETLLLVTDESGKTNGKNIIIVGGKVTEIQ